MAGFVLSLAFYKSPTNVLQKLNTGCRVRPFGRLPGFARREGIDETRHAGQSPAAGQKA
jgi:hypothetical protein